MFRAVHFAALREDQEGAVRRVQGPDSARHGGIEGHEIDVVADGETARDRFRHVRRVEFGILGLQGFERLIGDLGRVVRIGAERDEKKSGAGALHGRRPAFDRDVFVESPFFGITKRHAVS